MKAIMLETEEMIKAREELFRELDKGILSFHS